MRLLFILFMLFSPSLATAAKKTLICIDAGHGGKNKGAQSKGKRYQEKNLALATSFMLRDHLRKMGYPVYMTRKRDRFLPLRTRTNLANKKQVSLFVSIHFNTAKNKEAHGIEVFYYQLEGKKLPKAARLAEKVLQETLKQTKAKSRGVKTARFIVLKYTQMPAILVEGGFLSNTEEMRNLRSAKYLNKIAYGIAKGIDKFL